MSHTTLIPERRYNEGQLQALNSSVTVVEEIKQQFFQADGAPHGIYMLNCALHMFPKEESHNKCRRFQHGYKV